MIGTIPKRSDEAIDIELDQKYVLAREKKKEDSRKRKKKKNTDPSLYTQSCIRRPFIVHSNYVE
jgi:hypothetical protein